MDGTFPPAHAGRPTLTVDVSALRANLAHVRAVVGPDRALLAVVKADAYGHGTAAVCANVHDLVDAFVVVTIDEALTLRALAPEARARPVLVLQPVEPGLQSRAELAAALAAGCVLTPGSVAGARAIAGVAEAAGRVAPLMVHVDTGLRRCGVDADDAVAIAAACRDARRWLRLDHLSTHVSFQDRAGHPFNRTQVDRLIGLLDRVRAFAPAVRAHAAASGLTLEVPGARLDAVRVGAAMYGIDPSLAHRPGSPLRPAMRVVAPVVALRDVSPGEGVGYGHTYTAAAAGRVALVQIGYYDGYPRLCSNSGVVIVRGVACPVVGRVSMDNITVDVTACPAVRIGDQAVVLDDRGDSPASAYALAAAAQTIAYEIVSGIGPRARRVTIGAPSAATAPTRRPALEVTVAPAARAAAPIPVATTPASA